MAIERGFQRLKSYDLDRVYKQEIQVPHWERGTKEQGWFKSPDGKITKVHLLALSGSVGTDGTMEGEIVLFNHCFGHLRPILNRTTYVILKTIMGVSISDR